MSSRITEKSFRVWDLTSKQMSATITTSFGFNNAYIMQYTGFKDFDGKRIWEGDILQTSIDKCTVIWDSVEGKWGLEWETNSQSLHTPSLAKVLERTVMRVIGNIYENKEGKE